MQDRLAAKRGSPGFAIPALPAFAWSQSTQAQVRVWLACSGCLRHANHDLRMHTSLPQAVVARKGTPHRGPPARDARQQRLTVSGFKVSGFKMRRPIRTPTFSTEPLPCVNCVPGLGQDVMVLRQLCIVARQNITIVCQLCIVSRLPARPVDNDCMRPPRDHRGGLQGQDRGECRNERHRHAEAVDDSRYQHGGGGRHLWDDSANRRGGPPAARARNVLIGHRWPS